MFGKFKKKAQDLATDVTADVASNNTQAAAGDDSKSKNPIKNIGGKVKDAAVNKMLEKQLGSLPPQQKEMVMKAIKANPEFFEKMAKEIETLTKGGKNQMAASMEVMRKYQGDLQKIMMGK